MGEQQKRNKWANPSRSFQIGDLVFIRNELTPPSQWLMGRIVETYPDAHGHVRTCKVKTEKSDFVRPITSLCLLPTEDDWIDPSGSGFPS